MTITTRLFLDVAQSRVWIVKGSDAQSLLVPICFLGDVPDVVHGHVHHVVVYEETLAADFPISACSVGQLELAGKRLARGGVQHENPLI